MDSDKMTIDILPSEVLGWHIFLQIPCHKWLILQSVCKKWDRVIKVLVEPRHIPHLAQSIFSVEPDIPLKCLQWFYPQGFKCVRSATFLEVAKTGRLDVLQWIWKTVFPLDPGNFLLFTTVVVGDYFSSVELIREAARGGHLEMLQWVKQKSGVLWGASRPIATYAAQKGHIPILKWLQEIGYRFHLHQNLCAEAAAGDQLETLQWLRGLDKPCPWNFSTYYTATKHASPELVKWMESQGLPSQGLASRYRGHLFNIRRTLK